MILGMKNGGQLNLCVKECKIGGNLKIDTAWVDGETSGRLQANTT